MTMDIIKQPSTLKPSAVCCKQSNMGIVRSKRRNNKTFAVYLIYDDFAENNAFDKKLVDSEDDDSCYGSLLGRPVKAYNDASVDRYYTYRGDKEWYSMSVVSSEGEEDPIYPCLCDRNKTSSSTVEWSEKQCNIGSENHANGTCSPCAFFYSVGCKNGQECTFCHRCDPDEFKKQKKLLVKERAREAKRVKAEELERDREERRKSAERKELARLHAQKAKIKSDEATENWEKRNCKNSRGESKKTLRSSSHAKWRPVHVPDSLVEV